RFRQVPTFGRFTIRKFRTRVSDMKQFAARDYEDVLQCIIPCMEGLFEPADDKIVHDLLFECCTWHSHAKSHLYSDSSLHHFHAVTRRLTDGLRLFQKSVCPTTETPKEAAARVRREARRAAQTTTSGSVPLPTAAPSTQKPRKKTVKTEYNLDTYKIHAIPDVPACIREFGTTNGYSTMAV
ncbi:hypothetical protein BDZ89DRAFT_893776, partial [Hymenopellis radicata]